MILEYKTDGPAIGVGNRSVDFKEVRSLDYTSRTEWTDTVIQAPSVNLGKVWHRQHRGVVCELGRHDHHSVQCLTGTLETRTNDGGIYLPGSAFSFATLPPAKMDAAPEYTKSTVATSAKVCEDEDTCRENVSGTRYRDASGLDLTMYKTDAWFIPLKLGSYEVVKIEVRD